MLLRKGVYPYEYMDGWEKCNEISIPSKESFYSNLAMENISETDYIHANNYLKHLNLIIWVIIMIYTFKVTHRKACIRTYELDPAHFISLPGLAWQACLKKTAV